MHLQVTKAAHFAGHKTAIYALERAEESCRFYTGSADGMVVEWDAEKSSDGNLIAQVNQPVYCLKLLPGGRLLAGTGRGNLHIINLRSKQQERNIQVSARPVFDIKLNNQTVLVCCGDGSLSAYTADRLVPLFNFSISPASCRILAIHSNTLAVGSSDNLVYLLDYDNGKLVNRATLRGHTQSVFSLAFHPLTGMLLSGSRDATLREWDTHDLQCMQTINAHLLHIHQIAFSPDFAIFATCSMDKSIKLWLPDYTLIKVIDATKFGGHTSSVNKLLWLGKNALVSISDDRSAMLWKIG